MPNIALITASLQGGGAERCAADLSMIFAERGYRVFIFTDLSRSAVYEYAGKLVDYSFDLPDTDKMQGENPLKYKVDELEILKAEYGIDIAISFLQWPNYLNILSKGKEKVILTTHSVNSECARYEKAVFWSDETFRELYQYADFVTFPSDFCRKDWLAHYGDPNSITRTIYNPVHQMKVCVDDNKKNVVITVGRMQSVKRQWHLIKSFALVKKRCPDSRLIILGDGELRPGLEAVITYYKLEDCVEMPGNVRNVQDYLEDAKVFVMTSKCEAMPCSVLEALSAGVPVVSCDSPGGIREELGISYEQGELTAPLIGECGIITPYIDENSMEEISHEEEIFADEIVHLLIDDALRNKMAASAVKRVQMFSKDKIGEVWIKDILNNSLDKRITEQGELKKIIEKTFNSFQNAMNLEKIRIYGSYYRLLEKWMVLYEKNRSVKEYFISRGFENIIIYGMGKMANHLIEDIRESGINIICAIDRKVINTHLFPVITLDEPIPDADCIVITPVYDAERISQKLKNRTSIPRISLSDIIDACDGQEK